MPLSLQPIQPNEDASRPEYASEDCQQLLKMMAEFMPESGYHPPWTGYFIKEDEQIVGTCAFTGSPKEGRVELSYWTFTGHEGKGIATAACRELIAIARQVDPAVIITAKTAPEKNASTTVLKKNGFFFTEIVQDHEIGDAWEWTLRS